MKSQIRFSKEAIENYRGKVLEENSIVGRIWSSAKLLIITKLCNTKLMKLMGIFS